MLIRQAEESFRRGMEALGRGSNVEALALFEAALEIERRCGAGKPQPRYLSYYGLCLGLAANRVREGIEYCREAKGVEFYNADLCWNLGRLLLAAGRRKEAWEAFEEGLARQPVHLGIRREMERMGTRRSPVVPFLSRGNPVNVLLGKLSRVGAPPAPAEAGRVGTPAKTPSPRTA